jgi:hypothetical protein
MTRPVPALCDFRTFTIASSASVSDDIGLDGRVPVAIYMPAAWTAAAITFQVAYEIGGTYYDVYDSAEAELDIATPVAGKYHVLNSDDFLGATALRIRSGVTATPVNQGAEREIVVATAKPAR